MWVEKRENGNFKFVEEYKDYFTGKYRKVSITLEKDNKANRKLAQEVLREKIKKDQQEKGIVLDKDLTLKELIEKYSNYQKSRVKESTYRRNNYVNDAIKNILGNDVIVNHLNAAYIKSQFEKSEYDKKRWEEIRKRLLALLRWGYENEYIKDISYLAKLKPNENVDQYREQIEDKFLESYESNKLLDAMNVLLWKQLTEFLILTGLRIGEAIALEKIDVDIKGKVIHVTKTYDTNNHVTTTPKTSEAMRDVYMQPELQKLCRKISNSMKLQKLEYGYDNNPLFFQDNDGGHVHYDAYRKYVREYGFKCFSRAITPHIFRHTHASLLAEQELSYELISRRLGHKGSKVTREIYIHVTKKIKEKDKEKMLQVKIL